MAHYVFLNEDNMVIEVITGRNENEVVDGISNWEEYYSTKRNGFKCLRTSYNGSFRKNYAGVGFYYDKERDAFIPPKPFNSWILNEENCLWNAPVEYPSDGGTYKWNENNLSWDLINNG